MITPYKVYQRRITDNDDEIDFVAICEPSGNDRMVAGKYPKIIHPHLTFTHPNTVKLGKYCPIFSCKHALQTFRLFSRAFSTKLPRDMRLASILSSWTLQQLFLAFPPPPVFNQCILLISRLVAAVTIDSRFCVIMCGVKAVINVSITHAVTS